jgi:hypothetical protein
MTLYNLVDIYATFGTLCVFSISIENALYIKFNDKIIPRIGVLEKLIVDLMSLFRKFISDDISGNKFHTNLRPIHCGYGTVQCVKF